MATLGTLLNNARRNQTGSGGVTILYKVTRAQIGALVLDASVQETHVANVEVTKHPVEQGAAISDHAREEPETVTIEGLVSNTPIGEAERRAAGDQVKGQPGRASQALEQLLQMKKARELIDLVTGLRTYSNMLMTGLTIPRNAKQGEVLQFSAQFIQVRVVRSETAKLTSIPKKPTTKVKKSNQVTKPTPPATKAKVRQSLLLQLLNVDLGFGG